MSELAETYLRLDVTLSEEDLGLFQRYLEDNAVRYASGLFQQEPEFEAILEDGSLRVWLTAVGVLYAAVAGYGSLRAGIDYLIKDARVFSESVLENVVSSGISQDEILRFERRLGVPGQVKRLFQRLDSLERRGHELSAVERSEEVQSITRSLHKLLASVDTERDASLILSDLPKEFSSTVPERPPPDEHPVPPRVALRAGPDEREAAKRAVRPGAVRQRTAEQRPRGRASHRFVLRDDGFRLIRNR